MNRYLLHVSYVGSYFKGVTRVPPYYNFCDRSTIQGEIEQALKNLSPVNRFEIETSSRTDSGVHALHTTLHVDLENKSGQPYDPDHLTQVLNRRFHYTNANIRILKTDVVDPAYHVRENVARRSYLYRLAVMRRPLERRDPAMATISQNLNPIEEIERCFFIFNNDFDIERMRRVAPLFEGKHDFRSFMRPSIVESTKSPSFAIRKLHSLTIEEGRPACLTVERQRVVENTYQFWNIRIVARSFLYRQVRKIVGALIATAEGRLTHKDIYEMLTIPSYGSWPVGVAFTAPGQGLYLTGVEYELPEEESQEEPDAMSVDECAVNVAKVTS